MGIADKLGELRDGLSQEDKELARKMMAHPVADYLRDSVTSGCPQCRQKWAETLSTMCALVSEGLIELKDVPTTSDGSGA